MLHRFIELHYVSDHEADEFPLAWWNIDLELDDIHSTRLMSEIPWALSLYYIQDSVFDILYIIQILMLVLECYNTWNSFLLLLQHNISICGVASFFNL